MSNPFEPPEGPPPEKGGAGPSGSNPFEPPDSPPPEKGSQQPPGIPGNRPGASSSAAGKGEAPPAARGPDGMDVSIPDEPPPAYSSAPAQHTGESSVQAGPNRMDFSGPPPLPDRFQNYNAPQIEQQITGVGYGYRPDTGSQQQGGFAPPPHAPPPRNDTKTNPYADSKGSEKPMSSQPTGSSSAGPSAPDLSPTEIATPGRPLLRKGQLLVYPKNHFCNKCNNTGYKNNDPNNPHDADWRKYGKPYNLALQTSYKSAVGPYANPATQASSNFQRPLPDLSRPPQAPRPPPSNPGGWNQHPGNYRPPPPPQLQQSWGPPPQQQWGPPPPQIYHQSPYMGGGMMMNGGIVVKPGDPRIGGIPCWRCGGEGRELSFFGFDDGKCKECRGIGRIFR